jgi:LPS sulfotransferase NodH
MTRFLTPDGDPRAFIIISSMRSGSTLLVRHLRQITRAACFGEILRADFPEMDGWPRIVKRLGLPPDARDMHTERVADFWDLVLTRTLERKQWAGSKIFSDHRRGDPVWDRFSASNHRVFHLWRDSTFDTYVSLQLARATGEWKAPTVDATQDSDRVDARVVFEREAYLRYRSHIQDDVESVRQRYGATGRYVELEYAELTDLERMAALLESLFGEEVRLEERLSRQRPRPKIEYVVNRADAEPFERDSLQSGFWGEQERPRR